MYTNTLLCLVFLLEITTFRCIGGSGTPPSADDLWNSFFGNSEQPYPYPNTYHQNTNDHGQHPSYSDPNQNWQNPNYQNYNGAVQTPFFTPNGYPANYQGSSSSGHVYYEGHPSMHSSNALMDVEQSSNNRSNQETDSDLEASHEYLKNMPTDSDDDEGNNGKSSRNRRRNKKKQAKQVEEQPSQNPHIFNGYVPGTNGKGGLVELFCGDTGVRTFAELGTDGKFSKTLTKEFLARFLDVNCNVSRNLAVYTLTKRFGFKSCNKCYVRTIPLEWLKFGEREENVFEVDFKREKYDNKTISINGHEARKCLKSWVFRDRECEEYFGL